MSLGTFLLAEDWFVPEFDSQRFQLLFRPYITETYKRPAVYAVRQML